MARIGLLGGAFDPIHKGHVKMALLARDALKLDRVILVPSGTPPHKLRKLSDNASRLEMCRLVAEEYGFEASDFELNKEGFTYTVDTLEYFKEQYPIDTLFFILGGDSLDYIEEWYKAPRIMELCEIAVIPRRGIAPERTSELVNILFEKYGAKVHVVDNEYIDISSTQVREAIGIGLYIPSLLPLLVLEYLREKRLYR